MASYLWCSLWLAIASLTSALDSAWTYGPYLINNRTNSLITLNGMWYALSNSTTNTAQMDALTDADACTRDAALMDLLGINVIYVTPIDPTQNHDDCFSIFNSVGIYVVVMMRENGAFTEDSNDPSASYTTDLMNATFQVVDAVKDYENLLAIDIGSFPSLLTLGSRSLADMQKLYRTFVRDTKEYIALNSPRQIIIGGSIPLPLDSDLLNQQTDFLSCAIAGEQDDLSRIQYIGLGESSYSDKNVTFDFNETWAEAAQNVENSTVPIWIAQYGTLISFDSPHLEPGALNDTEVLYNTTYDLLSPYGPFNGGVRWEWTNVRVSGNTNWGLTILSSSDNSIQFTTSFDRLRQLMSQQNTESWLSSYNAQQLAVYDKKIDPPKCDVSLIPNKTTKADVLGSTAPILTYATDWALATRPAGLDALITGGAGGYRGQMVDVTVTTIKYTVKDSSGNVISTLSLKPSSSAARSTTARGGSATATGDAIHNSSGLSTGAKAGIGVGVSVGALAVIGATIFWFFRRRRAQAAKKREAEAFNGANDKNGLTAGAATGQQYLKAEIDSRPVSDLPTKISSELPAMSARMDGPPAELPAAEAPQELDGHLVEEQQRRS